MSGTSDLPKIDPSKPSVARVYDFLLGGKDNFASDREMAAKVVERSPGIAETAWMNKEFGARATRYMAEFGKIRQFIDLGSGIPTSPPSIHDVARGVSFGARVVYVDADPVVVAHSRALREIGPGLVTILADLRNPEAILSDPQLLDLIDFDKPVGIGLYSVMQTVIDDAEAMDIMQTVVDHMAPGSYLGLSHVSKDHSDPAAVAGIMQSQSETGYPSLVVRSDEQILELFCGCELVPPGLTDLREWRVDEDEEQPVVDTTLYGGVGRKP